MLLIKFFGSFCPSKKKIAPSKKYYTKNRFKILENRTNWWDTTKMEIRAWPKKKMEIRVISSYILFFSNHGFPLPIQDDITSGAIVFHSLTLWFLLSYCNSSSSLIILQLYFSSFYFLVFQFWLQFSNNQNLPHSFNREVFLFSFPDCRTSKFLLVQFAK